MFQLSTLLIRVAAIVMLSNAVNAAIVNTDATQHKKTDAPHYAYITHGQGYKTPSILKCAIDATTGDLSNCSETASGSFFGPTGVAFNNGLAYVSNSIADKNVTRCQIDVKSGELGNCVNTPDPTFSYLTGIAISSGHLYLVNHNNRVIQCALNAKTGNISGCGYTGHPAITAANITVNAGYAYVSNVQPSLAQANVLRCPINADGTLSNTCASTSGFHSLYGIAINNQNVYVTNGSTVSLNTVNAKGHLVNVKNISFSGPVAISFNNGYAYVANYVANDGNGTIAKCAVDKKTGDLLNCENQVNIDYPSSIAVY